MTVDMNGYEWMWCYKVYNFWLSFEPPNTTSCGTAEKSGGNVKSVSNLFGTQK